MTAFLFGRWRPLSIWLVREGEVRKYVVGGSPKGKSASALDQKPCASLRRMAADESDVALYAHPHVSPLLRRPTQALNTLGFAWQARGIRRAMRLLRRASRANRQPALEGSGPDNG